MGNITINKEKKMATSKILFEDKVDNTDRKFGASLEYFPVKIVKNDGQEFWAMFTESEIDKAIERAVKNKEDIPKSLWDKIFG